MGRIRIPRVQPRALGLPNQQIRAHQPALIQRKTCRMHRNAPFLKKQTAQSAMKPTRMCTAAGSLGGVTEACLLQPMDVVKTRLQLDRAGKYSGDCLSMHKFERFRMRQCLWHTLDCMYRLAMRGCSACVHAPCYPAAHQTGLLTSWCPPLCRHLQLRHNHHPGGGRQVALEGADAVCRQPDAQVLPALRDQRLVPEPAA